MKLTGRVWKLGDDVGATDILPAAYDKSASRGDWADCVAHVLEGLRPDFQRNRQPGDLIVGGRNLGAGHAHYHRGGVLGSKAAGIGALLGDSLNGLFFRSAIDEGYPAWPIAGISDFVDDQDTLEIDLAAGEAKNLTQGTTLSFRPCDKVVLDILAAGSAMNWAIQRSEHGLAA
jgi:3-isopropylmalate/(R)-2-methylmalate dehydratase small subunit